MLLQSATSRGGAGAHPSAASYVKARPVQKVFEEFYLETEPLVQLKQFFSLTKLDLKMGKLPRSL